MPPVLNETRAVVKLFNAELKRRLARHPSLHLLDFADDLLESEDGFRKDLTLDGTHMSPRYLELLEAKLPPAA